jgi:flagellin
LNAQAALTLTSNNLQKTLGRLSSGIRTNSSADDDAGFAIANRDMLDRSGLAAGIQAANDGISKLQIEDGAMNSISSLLDRALTLAAQSASDAFVGSRSTLDNEFQFVLAEINRTATAAGLNTGNVNLNCRSVFVGNTQTNTSVAVRYISFAINTAVDSEGLGISAQKLSDQTGATTALAAIQIAAGTLGTAQGRVGAAMNRLQFAISQAQTMSVSVSAAVSRIRYADIAQEAANLTKYNVLQQSCLAALAQANNSSSELLALLR